MTEQFETCSDVTAYHVRQSAAITAILDTMRSVIQKAAPKATEVISYGMPAFKQNKVLVWYAAYSRHIGFYPTPEVITAFKDQLSSYKTSKGAVQFPLDAPLPTALIKKMVAYRLKQDKANASTASKQQSQTQSKRTNGDATSVSRSSSARQTAVLDGILHETTADIKKALRANPSLLETWNTLTPIQRNEWICWVTLVAKAETRADHIRRMLEDLGLGKRSPCCWPGCPHRRPAAKKYFDRPKK